MAAVPLLPPAEQDRLLSANLTYPGVGATSAPPYPDGHRPIHHRTVLGHGRAAFEAAADDLMHWRMQARTGLRPRVSADPVEPGAVVLMHGGVGPLAMPIPCRVVYVLDGPDRRGFAYGTLPGHPESGEERFEVLLQPDGTVVFTVDGFSRPGRLLSRLAAPVLRLVVAAAVRRYGEVLRQG